MRFKSLEHITRSQLDKMYYDDLEKLIHDMEKELQAEQWRALIKETMDKQEAQIITPKVV